ncbi:hypothetical protein A5774_10535 [Corynebacterium sp. EPI-003-04-2554_SCH2473622]|jgi:hypothetical protein|nr:hypothetical protein A5774_10535 [Corynebacterium sp. EPI-003-04-2554_SCH2473622]
MLTKKIGDKNAFFKADIAITDAFIRIHPARQGRRTKTSRFDDIMALTQRFHESFIRGGVLTDGYELFSWPIGFDESFFES